MIYKPHDVINGCYVIFGYPSSHKNKTSLMQVMVRCLAHMHQEGFLSLTDICQTSTGINTRISISFLLKQWDVITHACRESNVEVKASIMDSQKVIPSHCAYNNGCNRVSRPSLMQVMVRCLTQICVKRVFFY